MHKIDHLQVKHEVVTVEKLDVLDFEIKLLKTDVELGEQIVLAHLAKHLGVVRNNRLQHCFVGELKAIRKFEPYTFP